MTSTILAFVLSVGRDREPRSGNRHRLMWAALAVFIAAMVFAFDEAVR